MDSRYRKGLILAFCGLLVSGCAAVPLQYEHPSAAKSPSSELKIAYAYPDDRRLDKEAMDKILDKSPADEISKIIGEEIQSTGLFKDVIPIAKGTPDDKLPRTCGEADILMSSCIEKLAWEVPNYDRMQTTAFSRASPSVSWVGWSTG